MWSLAQVRAQNTELAGAELLNYSLNWNTKDGPMVLPPHLGPELEVDTTENTAHGNLADFDTVQIHYLAI